MKLLLKSFGISLLILSCNSTPQSVPIATDFYMEDEWAVPYPEMPDRLVWAFLPRAGEVQGIVVSNDGQTRYFLLVEEALEALAAGKKIPPLAVLSVCMGDRLQEYGLQDGEKSLASDDGRGGEMGTKAHEYETWLKDVLIPFAEKKLGKTFPGDKRLVVGSSLGGISAFSTAVNAPEVFGGAGLLSPSFWVSSKTEDPRFPGDRRLGLGLLKLKTGIQLPRIWMSAGEVEGNLARSTFAVFEALKPLIKGGEQNLKCQILPDGEHNNDTWSQLFPEILEWYFAKN